MGKKRELKGIVRIILPDGTVYDPKIHDVQLSQALLKDLADCFLEKMLKDEAKERERQRALAADEAARKIIEEQKKVAREAGTSTDNTAKIH